MSGEIEALKNPNDQVNINQLETGEVLCYRSTHRNGLIFRKEGTMWDYPEGGWGWSGIYGFPISVLDYVCNDGRHNPLPVYRVSDLDSPEGELLPLEVGKDYLKKVIRDRFVLGGEIWRDDCHRRTRDERLHGYLRWGCGLRRDGIPWVQESYFRDYSRR